MDSINCCKKDASDTLTQNNGTGYDKSEPEVTLTDHETYLEDENNLTVCGQLMMFFSNVRTLFDQLADDQKSKYDTF